MTTERLCAVCQAPLTYAGRGRPPLAHPGECRRLHANARDEARRGQRFGAFLERIRRDRRRASVTSTFAGAESLPEIEPGTADPLGTVGYAVVDEAIVPENLPKAAYLATRRDFLAAESRERALVADEATYRDKVAEAAAAWPCAACPLASATVTFRRARERWRDAIADEYGEQDLRAAIDEIPRMMRRRPA